MGNNAYSGIHYALALDLSKKYNLEILIETGTHNGESSLWAAKVGFAVHTIEVREDKWEGLKEKFKELPILLWCGKSEELFAKVLKEVKEPALIFLDAHASESEGTHNPIMDEIGAIGKCKIPHVIMVDDARLFGIEAGWPEKDVVIDALQKTGRKCIEIDDVIVATFGEYKL